jgi:predicted GNAT superfamily acetyltransferase
VTAQSQILIRSCRGFEEFDACVRLQLETWGYDPLDTVPQREFVVIDRIGGQVIGAFDLARTDQPFGDGRSMIGFAMAMPAILKGQTLLHSHMLAVLPEYRNAGIGRKLKLAQREEALARGITRMEWTFDPLEIKNAYLNIARLGVVVHSYTPNLYGVFSSRLQAGLPTDRMHAEWWMDSPRVQAKLNGGPDDLTEIQETIVVPGAIREWRQSATGFSRAVAAQNEVRALCLDAFGRGLTVVGFRIEGGGPGGNGSGLGGESDGMYLLADRQRVDWREPSTGAILARSETSHP